MTLLPLVALVGRTNTGKSTLFNRLVEYSASLVSPYAGTTRDRIEGVMTWRGKRLLLLDTGGLDLEKQDPFGEAIRRQTEAAIAGADLLLFVVDGQQGIQPHDRIIAKSLKKSSKSAILVINKVDRLDIAVDDEVFRLGFKNSLRISAKNGRGTGDLLDAIVHHLPLFYSKGERTDPAIRIAVLGRTNVGKSSFVNAIVGKERMIVHALPHTTRDPQNLEMMYKKRRLILIDTAGFVRKKPKQQIERESIQRALATLKRTNIVLLMMDITSGVVSEDRRLAKEITDAECGVVLVLNKWDLVQNKTPQSLDQYLDYVRMHFPSLSWAPVVLISAKQRIRLTKVLDLALEVYDNHHRTISPEELLHAFRSFDAKKRESRRLARIKEIRQIGIAPPRFLLRVASIKSLPPNYLDSLKNFLRRHFRLLGTPLLIHEKLEH